MRSIPIKPVNAQRVSGTKRWVMVGLIIAATVLAAALVIGSINAQSTPIMRTASVQMRGLRPDASPIRIALLSDIHLGNPSMTPHRLSQIVDQVNAANPDIILIAGDFVTGHEASGAAERARGLEGPLTQLSARYGKAAVLGNHDHWTNPAAIRAALSKANILVLHNQAARLGPLTIVGVGDRFSGNDDIALSLKAARALGGPAIVLTHSPDLVLSLPSTFPLVLAGHTHCGQVVIPGLGPLLTRAPKAQWRELYAPRYRCGLVREPGRTTIITGGLGSGTTPIRLGAMPDWWLITVHP
jgi:predicted MPP superfamily phosphohydrolase